ncbi:MAG TPA: carbamoyltransferase HypF [Solirubrobacterales bacterium]
MAGGARRRVAARVGGTVQGVGFRPFAFRLASELDLAGFVLNDAAGVGLEVEGEPERVAEFLARLSAEAPPLAAVESLRTTELAATGERGFRIADSAGGAAGAAPVPADVATCDACLAELFDPADRRHRYPFVNCTACGPRFTIVRGVPYDRARTTMAGFEMCAACRAEYEDPADRRFHAEPNACPECGPRATLLDPGGVPLSLAPSGDAVAAAAALLAEGAIVAVKGVGGYHLACRAADADAVAALRERKRRESKPFALLVRDLAAARALVELGAAEEELLSGPERPIVLAPRLPDAAVAEAAAPGCADLGLMLPHSPLHHLLVADAGEPLVMTSGNLAEQPIVHRDEEAMRQLGPVADALLVHDRPIETAAEDSVVRPTGDGSAPLIVRRARGYVPAALSLDPPAAGPLLACGAELKSAFCLAAGGRAWVGPQSGDLRSFEALRAFERGVEHFERLCGVRPETVAHDLHPDYLSTRYALGRGGVETLAVQHHHAHLAAVLAEHGVEEQAVGAIYDGAGLGPDGSVWGGEILVGDAADYVRAGSLYPVPLPGGDAAAREPWRMACAWLAAALEEPSPPLPATLADKVSEAEWQQVAKLAASGTASPPTSSAGRLFDAVAAIIGLRARINHEAQAAMELEAIARTDERTAYPLGLVEADGPKSDQIRPFESRRRVVIDPREAIRALVEDLGRGVEPGVLAARFHNGLAAATAAALAAAAEAHGLDVAVLSGGVFQNRLLLERTTEHLRAAGLRVLVPERLPPNDGAIAYGQAAVAAGRSHHDQ